MLRVQMHLARASHLIHKFLQLVLVVNDQPALGRELQALPNCQGWAVDVCTVTQTSSVRQAWLSLTHLSVEGVRWCHSTSLQRVLAGRETAWASAAAVSSGFKSVLGSWLT